MNVDPMRRMLVETANMPASMYNDPAIVLTRYMDNTYIAFCNMPAHLLGVSQQFLVQLQAELYQVPFKWEPEGQFLHWGECRVSCTPTHLSLTLKGFASDLFDPVIISPCHNYGIGGQTDGLLAAAWSCSQWCLPSS